MDELAKPWIVVRNGQIIHADDHRRCAYAVAKEAGATVYWCDGMMDGALQLVKMAEFDEDDGIPPYEGAPEDYQGWDSDSVEGGEQ